MHLKDDTLRAYLDHEVPAGQESLMREHLTRCSECASRLEQVSARTRQVKAQLDLLTPGPRELPRSTPSAYQHFQINKKETRNPMMKRRSIWTTLSILAVLALLFSLTPVQAWAGSFLGLFRVEKVTIIPFDMSKIEQTHGSLSGQKEEMQSMFQDNFIVQDQGETQKVDSPAEAAEQAGFTPRLPNLPGQSPALLVQPGMQATIVIDQPGMQAMLDAAGVDVTLPAEVDGQTINLDVQKAVLAGYGECPDEKLTAGALEGCTVLIQLPSPTVEMPEGLNVPEIGEAMLQFLGMSAEEAKSLSATIDWTSTLVLPIPQGEDITYEDVAVDGVSGTLLESTEKDSYTLVWVKNGNLYMLAGAGGKEAARTFVSALR